MKVRMTGALLAAMLVAPAHLQAQSWVSDAQIVVRSNAPTVGIALVVDGGAANDRAGREGETWLYAHALAEALTEVGSSTGARRAEVDVLEDRWSLSLLVEPGDALSTLRDLRAAIAGSPSPGIVGSLQARLSASFAFEAGSPVREMEQERRTLLDGFESPWARPPRGNQISVDGLSAAELSVVARGLTPNRLTVGVVGPVDSLAVVAALGLSRTASAPDATDTTVGQPTMSAVAADLSLHPGPYSGPVAWQTGDRVRVIREVTNSWITVAFPVPADLPQTLLEFLGHRMDEEITTDPPDPGIFDAEVLIVRRPGGRLLVVNAAVLPEAAERWESQILQTAAVAAEPVQEAFFHWLRRRFRSTVLLNEAAPEVLARRLAEDLLMGIPAGREVQDESWELSPSLLLEAARALGEPRILVYGPDFGSNDAPSPDRLPRKPRP